MPALDVLAATRVDPPFPGLRPFKSEESHLFFGRETHVEDLLQRLSRNRFLAVVGTSGSGKSSLILAGLLPDLYRGYLVGATSRWRIAVLRPGRAPLEALASALDKPDALGPDPTGKRPELLLASTHGLLDAVNGASLPDGEALLVVVDQFEELFRFGAEDDRERTDDHVFFVSLLLEAAEAWRSPVYVVLTMRSDYLGDCARFRGLPEALNRSQYLVPRLTREQRQQAIEQPLLLADIGIEPGLVQSLLNDSGDDPDELPVLQHVLMRTYAAWKHRGGTDRITLVDYEKAGRMVRALNDHAEQLLASLAQTLPSASVERLFRCLTTIDHGRMVRRPAPLERVLAVLAADTPPAQEALKVVIRLLARSENSLLVISTLNSALLSSDPSDLGPGAMIDITHESLIRKWDRLREWVQAEAKGAEWYRDLERDLARAAAPWRDPDLAQVESLCAQDAWNQAWAAQYSDRAVSFSQIEDFLRESRSLVEAEKTRGREEREREERRLQEELAAAQELAKARLRGRRWLTLAVTFLLALLAAIGVWFYREQLWTSERAALSERVNQAGQKMDAVQAEMLRVRARLEHTTDLVQREGLQERLADLQRKYDASVKEGREAQHKLDEQSPAQALTDKGPLLKQIADLQAQVKEAQRQRDEAQRQHNEAQRILDEANVVVGSVGSIESKQIRTPTVAEEVIGILQTRDNRWSLRPGEERTNTRDGLEYVLIPPGSFTMGCASGDSECNSNEKKPHFVTIERELWIGKTEVTVKAYKAFAGAKMPTAPDFNADWRYEEHPIVNVTWNVGFQK